jgi:integrase
VLDSTKPTGTEESRRAITEIPITRRRYQSGNLSVQGKNRKVYVLRYYEPVLLATGSLGHIRKAVALGSVSDIGTKKQARVLADEILRRVNLGHLRPQSTQTLGDFARNEWSPTVLPTLKFSTRKQYGFILASHVLPALGQVRLCDLTREHLQAFLGAKTRAGLSWETVAHLRNVLSKILGAAVEWRYLQENLTKLTKLPRRPPRKPRPFLTGQQVSKLLEKLSEPATTIVLLLVTTGTRIGEILALRWKHVDFERGILQVREAVYDGHFGTPKTASSIADLPLGPESAAVLRQQLTRAGNGPQPEDLVFSNRTGGPVNPKNLLRRVLYPACVKAEVPRVSWHALRHTHATLLAAGGASPKLIQSQLRHATTQLALELYTHQLPGFQREAVERLEQDLFVRK